MKVAITSDLHLKPGPAQESKSYGKDMLGPEVLNPERFNAFRNILQQMLDEDIKDLIIAGDLFDAGSQNYQLFDEICSQQIYRNIKLYIIPGNHDPVLSRKYFTAQNIMVLNEPAMMTFGEAGIKFLFIPYIHGRSMGEMIAEYKEKPGNSDAFFGEWALIGHGDYLSGKKEPNIYEKGIYMPLSRNDIEYYKPVKVILGHIHKKSETGRVYYPGSPCGMDINETGKRSFALIDLNDLAITEKTVETDIIFLSENLVVIPAVDEEGYVREKISTLIKSWHLNHQEIPKARLRLKVSGYTSDKNKLEKIIRQYLADFNFYDKSGPDLNSVFLFNDPERISIVERVKQSIESLDTQGNGANPPGVITNYNIMHDSMNDFVQAPKDIILEQALHIILKE